MSVRVSEWIYTLHRIHNEKCTQVAHVFKMRLGWCSSKRTKYRKEQHLSFIAIRFMCLHIWYVNVCMYVWVCCSYTNIQAYILTYVPLSCPVSITRLLLPIFRLLVVAVIVADNDFVAIVKPFVYSYKVLPSVRQIPLRPASQSASEPVGEYTYMLISGGTSGALLYPCTCSWHLSYQSIARTRCLFVVCYLGCSMLCRVSGLIRPTSRRVCFNYLTGLDCLNFLLILVCTFVRM